MTTIAPPVELQAIEKLREEELEEARSIQNVMLPVEALCVGSVRISHAFQPVTEVGGDFLDYFQLADGCVGLYLGDVSGKGLPAAMYAALAVGTLRGVHKTGMCPSQVLATLNRRLMIRGTTRRHAAVQYAVFDPQTQVMKIAGGGMPGPFHLAASGCCRALEVQGIPPGLFEPSVAYETLKVPLVLGDSVLFFTDGLSDAIDAKDDSFGVERLQSVCAAHSECSPAEFLGELFAAVSRFAGQRAQHDDMAAAVFQYRQG